MPGKINPTQCEPLTMLAVRVLGTDHTVPFAGSPGNLQLNVYKPAMLHHVLTRSSFKWTPLVRFAIAALLGSEPNKNASESILVIV